MPTNLIRKQFLLTEEENAKIEKQAEKEGLSVSNLTRKLHGLEPLGAGGKRENTGRPKKNASKYKNLRKAVDKIVGSVDSGANDLATNPKYLKGFGVKNKKRLKD